MGYLLDIALRTSGAGDSATPATVSRPPASIPAASLPSEQSPGARHAPSPEEIAPNDSPATVRPAADLGRAIALAELHGLIRAIAAHEPEFWSENDVAEAVSAGEADLDAALQTWRALAERLGVAQPEGDGARNE